jgi:protocatechuate 3,4-dioxygenase beta subunit
MMAYLVAVLVLALTIQAGSQRPQPAPLPAPAGRVAGTVIDAASGRPVRFAEVTLSGSDERNTVSDDDGAFVFHRVPGGTYALRINAPGYLDTWFGQIRPGTDTRGTTITLVESERREQLVIRLTRGASIAGTVRDDRGEPVFGATVVVLRRVTRHGGRGLQPVATADTDERGAYRIPLLPPRVYVVSASSSRSIETTSGARGFAPVFHPASASAGGAKPLSLEIGEDRSDVDFQLPIVPVSRLTGRVFDPGGQPVAGIAVRLSTGSDGGIGDAHATTDEDGRFVFESVRPGSHLIETTPVMELLWGLAVRHLSGKISLAFGADDQSVAELLKDPSPATKTGQKAVRAPAAQPRGRAALRIEVGASEADVVLTLEPPRSVSGRIVFAEPTRRALQNEIGIELSPVDAQSDGVRTTIAADGTFTLRDVPPGTYEVRVEGLAPDWHVKSAMSTGADAIDVGLEVPPDRDINDLTIDVRTRGARLSGRLMDATSTASGGYKVILFAEDERLWRASSRVIAEDIEADGTFAFDGVRSGSYRLAVMQAVEPDEWRDPELLRRARMTAIAVTLAEGEHKSQIVRIK